MHIERSSDYRAVLERLLESNTDFPVELLFVGDIAAWAKSTGATVAGNPTATALVGSPSNAWRIVIQERICAERVESNIQAMELFENHGQNVASLNSPERFLLHTVLHELAHLVLSCGNDQEELCNAWAFQRLAKTDA